MDLRILLNLRQLSKDKWDFDSSRDVILSFKFTHEQHLILSTNEYFKMLKYKDRLRSTFSYGKLLVASLLSETPNLTLSELKRRLDTYSISLSRASLSKVEKELSDVMLPYVYLDNLGLSSTLIIFIWEPFLSEEENDFLTKYFANYFPQATFYFSKNGFLVAVEIPSNGENIRTIILNMLRKHYSDSVSLLTPGKFLDKSLGALIQYWDQKRRAWRIEDWMLPNIEELIKNK